MIVMLSCSSWRWVKNPHPSLPGHSSAWWPASPDWWTGILSFSMRRPRLWGVHWPSRCARGCSQPREQRVPPDSWWPTASWAALHLRAPWTPNLEPSQASLKFPDHPCQCRWTKELQHGSAQMAGCSWWLTFKKNKKTVSHIFMGNMLQKFYKMDAVTILMHFDYFYPFCRKHCWNMLKWANTAE